MKSVRIITVPPSLIVNLTNILIDVVEAFLVLRFVLRLFGASSSAPFVRWIYDTTDPLLTPFRGMFPSPVANGLVFDFPTLFAIIIYLFVGYLVTEILETIIYHSEQRVIKVGG